MLKRAVRFAVVCLMFAIFFGQASTMFAYQSCDDTTQDAVIEHIDIHTTSESTAENDCCDEDCCPTDCLCAECLSMLGGYLAVSTYGANHVAFSESVDVTPFEQTTSRISSLYRPPISIS